MPRLTIDRRDVEVPPGATILDAARRLDIDIPTLCFREGCQPPTSCLVCMVKVAGHHRLVPACATAAEEGMEVESETPEVRELRRAALELLLSDHLGDCLAPCWFSCPARMDIPRMLREIMAEDWAAAIATVKRDIALPAVLGRVCPAPCEKACRRGRIDGPVSICQLKRIVADVDLASGNPYTPECRPASSRRVAVIGAGPTGLAAAYYLAQQGHACTVFDEADEPGGRLWHETTPEELPRDVLAAEVATIARLGIELRGKTRVGGEVLGKFDAVLIAAGATAREQAAAWGVKTSSRGIEVDRETYATGVPGVFAAGNAIRGKGLVVRSVADGKEVAAIISQYLAGEQLAAPPDPFSTKMGRLEPDELASLVPPLPPGEGRGEGALPCASPCAVPLTPPLSQRERETDRDTPAQQAARCLHCDCRKLEDCRLRHYAGLYNAAPGRYKSPRRTFQQDARHADVIFEPGKCIACGLCVQITAAAGESLGLAFVGRGFDVRVGVPLGRPLSEALRKVAAECVEACPTAALAWKESPSPSGRGRG